MTKPTYAMLKKKHCNYYAGDWMKLRLLANGGELTNEEKKLIIPKSPNEPDSNYTFRLDNAYVMPYLGQMLSYYISAVVSDPVEVDTEGQALDEYYKDFSKDVYKSAAYKTDINGHNQKALWDAFLCGGVSYCLVDLPAAPLDGYEPKNRLEEEKMGQNKGYLCPLDPIEVYNVVEDDDGQLKFVVVHHKYSLQEDITDVNDNIIEDFTVYYKDRFVIHRFIFKKNKPPRDKDTPTKEIEQKHTFGSVPVERLILPDELKLAEKIGGVAKKIVQKLNTMDYGSDKSLIQFLAVKLQQDSVDEAGSLDPDRATNQTIGYGRALVLASGDDAEYIGASAEPFKWAQDNVAWLRGEMATIISQSALNLPNSGAALQRSGDSRKIDLLQQELILKNLGVCLKHYTERLFTKLAAGRKDSAVTFCAKGAEDFRTSDLDGLVDRMTKINALDIPSPTFKSLLAHELVKEELVGHPPEDIDKIKAELDAAYSVEDIAGQAAATTPDDGSDLTDTVMEQLSDDFPEEAFSFLSKYEWRKEDVAMPDIDWQEQDTWRVNTNPDRKTEFVGKVGSGMRKPAILLEEAGKDKYRVIDGHSRLSAAKHLALDSYPCYIVEITNKADIDKALEIHGKGE